MTEPIAVWVPLMYLTNDLPDELVEVAVHAGYRATVDPTLVHLAVDDPATTASLCGEGMWPDGTIEPVTDAGVRCNCAECLRVVGTLGPLELKP